VNGIIRKIKNKINNSRKSKNIFWHFAVEAKDLVWLLVYCCCEYKKYAKVFFVRKKLFSGALFDKNVQLESLLPLEKFAPVFEDFRGKKIGLVRMPGNVGDRLIDVSAMQLANEFGIDFGLVNKGPRFESFNRKICLSVDEFAVSGGGNMGDFYKDCYGVRKNIFKYKKPVTVLPQTFVHSDENLPYKKVWLREKESLKYRNSSPLAPDLVLGYRYSGSLPRPKYKVGIWLRNDHESVKNIGYESLGDPESICKNEKEYIQLAALYEKIITDRLHFAISGLIARRKVVLLPNNYFKNRALFEAWLKDLGCEWSDIL